MDLSAMQQHFIRFSTQDHFNAARHDDDNGRVGRSSSMSWTNGHKHSWYYAAPAHGALAKKRGRWHGTGGVWAVVVNLRELVVILEDGRVGWFFGIVS